MPSVHPRLLGLAFALSLASPAPADLCGTGPVDILLTNDDGYQAAGIRALYVHLRAAGHRVLLVAPDRNLSGTGASFTWGEVNLIQNPPWNPWIQRFWIKFWSKFSKDLPMIPIDLSDKTILMTGAFGGIAELWQGTLAVLAMLSMVVGNLIALNQRSLKRMLAIQLDRPRRIPPGGDAAARAARRQRHADLSDRLRPDFASRLRSAGGARPAGGA